MIFKINLFSSLLIIFYSIIFVRIFKNGYLNKILYNDSYLRKRLNERLSVILIVIGGFFLIIDLIAYFFMKQNFILLINTIIKLLFYKIFEYYYFIKSKKFKRDYLKHFKEKSEIKILYLGIALIFGIIFVFLLKYKLFIFWIYLLLFILTILVIYLKANTYKYWLYFLKINQVIVLMVVLFALLGFPTELKYLPLIGLFFVI